MTRLDAGAWETISRALAVSGQPVVELSDDTRTALARLSFE